MQGYMHKLGNILLDCEDVEPVPNEPLLSVLMEAASLYCCVTAYNVAILKHAYANRLDNGQAVGSAQLGDAFYTQLLVSALNCLVDLPGLHCLPNRLMT